MSEWVSIHRGAYSQVLVLRCWLEARGFAVQVRDEVMKVVDPFITGQNALATDLLVEAEHAAEASTLLEQCLAEQRGPAPETASRSRKRWMWLILLAFGVPVLLMWVGEMLRVLLG